MHLDRCQLDRSYSPAAFFSEALYFWAKVGSRKANKHINNSKPGDAVYESFAGSGTTIIAAEQTRRVFAAIEIDPAYVEVVTARWEAFTGLRAILAASGEGNANVAASRSRQRFSP
jgi:tRNA/tmRNA/rRNA uracil-C5-methylase (TrmA/RlmC/RlmD family)